MRVKERQLMKRQKAKDLKREKRRKKQSIGRFDLKNPERFVVSTDLFGNQKFEVAAFSKLHYYYSSNPETRLIIKPTGLTLCRVANRKLLVESANSVGVLFPNSTIDELNEKHKKPPQPKNNEHGRILSRKAAKRIKKAVGTLVMMSREKWRNKSKHGQEHAFRVNFITLTLPSLQSHLDETIKNECLNQFLTELRQLGVSNYVWVAEPHKNGSIHFHIATDSFVEKDLLQSKWNRITNKLGYVDRYAEKMNKLTFEMYWKQYCSKEKKDVALSRYERGMSSNWSNPPSTKIHAIYNLRNVASYMSKYMTKTPDEIDIINGIEMTRTQRSSVTFSLKSRKISGRRWGQSQSLSGINKNIGSYLVSETGKLTWTKALAVVNKCVAAFPDRYCETDYSKHVGANPVDLERVIPRFFADIRKQIRAGGYLTGISPN